jgi:N-[(2S)-2-amino-2-carboxyethyl]-L-glutamate dehydrogenase
MLNRDLQVIGADQIRAVLAGRERAIIDRIADAYVTHALGSFSLPHSTFLRFPDSDVNRIIALPAYLGGSQQLAGLKWIASFPGNASLSADRASAVIILNCTRTGRARALLEGSLISAKRTAASAALAASVLHRNRDEEDVALIGAGAINYEILRFLAVVFPRLRRAALFDLRPESAAAFARKCSHDFPQIEISPAASATAACGAAPLVSFATTAIRPHIQALAHAREDLTVLHVSLRDLAPDVILACDNVVDDRDHVCRASTSMDLAAQMTGGRQFIRATIGEILLGRTAARADLRTPAVFSPFGLGILDLALADMAYGLAVEQELYQSVSSFLPEYWLNDAESTLAKTS